MQLADLFSKIYNTLDTSVKSASEITKNNLKFTGDGILYGLTVLNGWFSSSSSQGRDGLYITHAYEKNPLVFMVVDKIAANSAALPRDIQASTEATEIIEMPNQTQNRQEFDEEIGSYYGTTGNSFSWLTRGIGAGHEWVNLEPERVTIEADSLGMLKGYLYDTFDGKQIKLLPEEVMHIKRTNISNSKGLSGGERLRGSSALKPLWEVIEASNSIFAAESVIFKNKGIIGFLSNQTEVPLLDHVRDQIQEDLNDDIGGAHKFNQVRVSNANLKFVQLGMSPTDLKTLESNLAKLRIICSVFGVDSSLFNDPENKTFSNRKEAEKAAYTDSYIPLAEKIDGMKMRFLAKALNEPKITIEVDTTEIDALKTEEQMGFSSDSPQDIDRSQGGTENN